jgi:hypothetical protein
MPMDFSKKNHKLKKGNKNEVSKTLFTIALALIVSIASHSQVKNIETESVALDNFITFIVEHFSIEADSTRTKNITFLIETYSDSFNTEDSVILKQAFKLLSKRFTENDLTSIVTHSHFNCIALNQAQAKAVKKLLHVIEYPKPSAKTLQVDGIELAYRLVKVNFIEDSENSVIMIRMPNRKSEVIKTEATESKKTNKTKSNAVVLAAIALLLEIIALIKE